MHLHNVVAIVLWWAWRPRRSWLHAIPIAVFAGLSGLLWLWTTTDGGVGPVPTRLGWEVHAAQLAPGFSEANAPRMVALFCFAQAVHYAIWLRVVPEDDRDRPTPRSFGQTLRALRREVGRPVLVVAVLAAVTFAVWATIDLAPVSYTHLGPEEGPYVRRFRERLQQAGDLRIRGERVGVHGS